MLGAERTTHDRPYTRAVKTGPDGGWVDVPVTEGRYSYEPIRPGDSGEIWTTRDDLPTGKRRPVSWAPIRPGDTVIYSAWPEKMLTVVGSRNGVVEMRNGYEELTFLRPEDLTLVCTDEIPEHRASHPAWQWPT